MRAYKIRYYPTRTEECALARWFGHGRWLWNWALDARRKAYARRSETLTSVDLSRIVTRMKRSKSYGWLREVPESILAQKLRDLDVAYRNLFEGRARFPKFKSRHGDQRVRVRFDARHTGKAHAWLEGRVVLPQLAQVKLRGRSLPKAMPKLVTVSRDACARYWVSFVVDEPIERMAPAPNVSVGIDVGITSLVTLSNGEKIENPRHLEQHLAKLGALQKRVSRQCKGSNRQRKLKKQIARLHARIGWCRREHRHQLTHRLVSENQVISIEDVNADGMGRSARGTREAPGKNVRAKAGLNRSLKDAALGELRRQLEYKSAWHGRTVVAVDRWFPSSRLCSTCGAHKGKLALSDRTWQCQQCATIHDRDANAAINIDIEGLRILYVEGRLDGQHHPEEPGRSPALDEPVMCAPLAARGMDSIGSGPVAVSARIGQAA